MTVILILSLLVILHELGHFFAALWLKIRVEEFGLGYPPKATRLFTWKKTDFTLNWIPFGGFVRLWGEDAPIDLTPEPATELRSAAAFYTRPAWQRLAVTLAGPITNALVAVILFGLVFSIGGIPVSLDGQPRIAQIISDTPAAKAGLLPHYQVTGFLPVNASADSTNTELIQADTISAVQKFVAEHRGQTWQVVSQGPCKLNQCESNQQIVELYLRTEIETPANQGAIGITFAEYELQFYPWYEMPWRGIGFGLQQTAAMSQLMIQELAKMVAGLVKGQGLSPAVAGPIGIVHQAEEAGLSQAGWLVILNFTGMISLNLAIMNILPIPALDGGRVAMILLEPIFGKKKIARFEGYVNYGGFLFLIGLLVTISIRDIQNW